VRLRFQDTRSCDLLAWEVSLGGASTQVILYLVSISSLKLRKDDTEGVPVEEMFYEFSLQASVIDSFLTGC